MTHEKVKELLSEGFQILKNGEPLKIQGDLKDYLSGLDKEVLEVLILKELLTWNDQQLQNVRLKL